MRSPLLALAMPSAIMAFSPTTDYFTYPSTTNVEPVKQGTVIQVQFVTTFDNPYITLYCSNINNPIIREKITPPSKRTHALELHYAPQPNCVIHLQNGDGPEAQTQSFGTGVFEIQSDPSWKGNEEEIPGSDGTCNCESYCTAFASAQCKTTRTLRGSRA